MERIDVVDTLADDLTHAVREMVEQRTGRTLSNGQLDWVNEQMWKVAELSVAAEIS